MSDLQGITAAAEPLLVRKLHTEGRKLGIPVSGTFELTSGCNFNCKMCYIHAHNEKPGEKKELTAAEWLDIGRQAAQAGTVFLLLTGGEPLLRQDFPEIYTGLKQLGMMISINTNGYLLNGKIAELLEKNPPMRLNVTLYADSNDGYRKQCGVGAFDRVVRNIRRMKNAGIETKLNVTFTGENADRCEDIAALVRKLALHCQSTVYTYPPVRKDGAGAPTVRLSPEQAARLRIRWDILRSGSDSMQSALRQLLQMQTRECEDIDRPVEGVRCRAGHTAYWIDSQGKMLMCGMIPVSEGSVTENGFSACWEKTRAFAQSVRMPAKCTACRLRPVCCVCPAACYAETGEFTQAPRYLCEMSECLADELSRLYQEGSNVRNQ
ncbi:MAG: radical SAM protein [Clostridia bacterium]|nr:radical SAM protein [Clostridia bacterium]